jgi:pimeloyl-ACP methyl ester carboxylesterase
VALNPYDYGRRGGIRRSSPLANVLFTGMLWPLVGSIVARTETKGLLQRVLAGGLHDPHRLPADLVDELYRCGSLPGHARAFRSLCLQWETWVEARGVYGAIDVPVTLAYGDEDWSRPAEREANALAIPDARFAVLESCGHFSCLEKPEGVADLIGELA